LSTIRIARRNWRNYQVGQEKWIGTGAQSTPFKTIQALFNVNAVWNLA
jgi:hypothetical protein